MKKKLRNRESALAARERKKKKMLELESRVAELGKENDDLRSENSIIRNTLISVMQKYGAPEEEIKEVLRIADAKRTIKKEPLEPSEMAKKPKPENKRTLLRGQTTQATKVTLGGPEKKCRKIIKQEHGQEPMIKLPKVIANNSTTTNVPTKLATSLLNGVFVQKNIQVRGIEQTVKQEPVEPTRRRTSWESVDEQNQSNRYSPPWTPPDMTAMQNSPSSDSAYSTGSENGFNSVQFIPINNLQQQQNFQQQETVTLYDTEITYDQRTTLPRTTTTPSTRLPRYHSYHELMGQGQDQGVERSEWINLLQNNDIDKLKPEDFLAEPPTQEQQQREIKVEESMDMSVTSKESQKQENTPTTTTTNATTPTPTTADDDKLFNDRSTQSFFQSQNIQLNLDEVFGNEVFGPF